MCFRISANLGDRKPFFRFAAAAPGAADVEVLIEDKRIDRMEASRMLRGMADRLLECDWPPGEAYSCARSEHPAAADRTLALADAKRLA